MDTNSIFLVLLEIPKSLPFLLLDKTQVFSMLLASTFSALLQHLSQGKKDLTIPVRKHSVVLLFDAHGFSNIVCYNPSFPHSINKIR